HFLCQQARESESRSDVFRLRPFAVGDAEFWIGGHGLGAEALAQGLHTRATITRRQGQQDQADAERLETGPSHGSSPGNEPTPTCRRPRTIDEAGLEPNATLSSRAG